jgi:3-hydroxyisobutyrate dehydrogenase-like beta-hydroxyacid dehydrogenase
MASADVKLPSNIGFIGLGNMGFPMFSNLVSKLPETATVHFYDVLPQSIERGLKESGAVAKLDPCCSSREVAEKSVRALRKSPRALKQAETTDFNLQESLW